MRLIPRGIKLALGWSFCAIYLGSFVVFSILTLGRFRDRLGERVVHGWGRVVLWISRVDVEFQGAHHLAGEKPRIVVFNHASSLDVFIVCATLPPRSVAVVKHEVLAYPFLGWAMRCLNVFLPIDRGSPERSRASIEAAAARIRSERLNVLIAPEGTRSRDGSIGRFKLGALRLALATGAPVVPMVIHGARELQPYGQWAADPGRVRVSVLPPIEVPDLTEETLSAHADALRNVFTRALAPGADARVPL